MASNGDKTRLVTNQPYDETLSIYDDEEIVSTIVTPSPRTPSNIKAKGRKPDPMAESLLVSDDEEFDHDEEEEEGDEEDEDEGVEFQMANPPAKPNLNQEDVKKVKPSSRPADGPRPPTGGHVIEASDDENDDDQSESSEDEDGVEGEGKPEGTYDPVDYEHLPVNQEIKELFQYISRYTPQTIDLDFRLKPFIPDYIPAVGDIDAFLKVNRPDDKPETLGLQIIDEPSAQQSDPTVLDLKLRSISKQTSAKQMTVRSLSDVDKNPKALDTWVTSIGDLHRQKPPQNVHYTKPMPDIDVLMQEWPAEFEEMLKTTHLPSADIDCDLGEYIDMICSLLDIPVHPDSRIQSLHVLFTLYSEFKNSQHFNQLAQDNQLASDMKRTHLSESKSSSQTENITFNS